MGPVGFPGHIIERASSLPAIAHREWIGGLPHLDSVAPEEQQSQVHHGPDEHSAVGLSGLAELGQPPS